jgi:hypothetical protein
MSSNALPTLSGDRPLLRDELARLVPALHTEGLSTHVYSDGLRTTSWLIVEKDGNVASIEYDHFGHPKVIFAIKPEPRARLGPARGSAERQGAAH